LNASLINDHRLKSNYGPDRRWWCVLPTVVSVVALTFSGLSMLFILIWQAITASGNPDPLAVPLGSPAAVLDIGVLVFREGLECILVLAAVTAGMAGAGAVYRQPIAAGAGAAFICTLITWRAAIGLMDDLTTKMSALTGGAAQGGRRQWAVNSGYSPRKEDCAGRTMAVAGQRLCLTWAAL
jgi:hypothetical protein